MIVPGSLSNAMESGSVKFGPRALWGDRADLQTISVDGRLVRSSRAKSRTVLVCRRVDPLDCAAKKHLTVIETVVFLTWA